MKYDVLGIGNAIMDVIAPVNDSILATENIEKGSMTLIDEARALHLHEVLNANAQDPQEVAGGSGANTMAGIASLGVRGAYLGKVSQDALGERFNASLGGAGVAALTNMASSGPSTARCLIAVTPDAERSMSTFLGANTGFSPADIDVNLVKASKVTYMEGYLFDTDLQKKAFLKAAKAAKAGGQKLSLTLSDSFCVDRHREDFKNFVDNYVDILFANTDEILSLYETPSLENAVQSVKKAGLVAAITRSEKGSIIVENDLVHEIGAVSVDKVVDTTGAGDQYAAGVLSGHALGMGWADAGYLGSICAAEVISHYGARPLIDIHANITG